MYLGQVLGTVVVTCRSPGLEGVKFLVVQPLDDERRPAGKAEVACDTVQAGVGDFVWLVGSREAAQAMPETFVPVDAAIVGIVEGIGR